MKPINVLSFFDGMSGGQQSLKNLGIPVANYIAIEIDPRAKSITKANFPNTIFYGDITELVENEEFYNSLPEIHIVFAGSPCQGLSQAGKRKGLTDPRSALFMSFNQIFKEIKYKQGNPHIPFFFENVDMTRLPKGLNQVRPQDFITEALGVDYIMLDSIDYSPCKRMRMYWTNIYLSEMMINKYNGNTETYKNIMDKNIQRKNIIPANMDNVTVEYTFIKSIFNKKSQLKTYGAWLNKKTLKRHQANIVFRTDSKMSTLLSKGGGWGGKTGLYLRKKPKTLSETVLTIDDKYICVKPSIECCLVAMGFPRNYFDHETLRQLSDTAKREAIGNSWSVQTVSLLLRGALLS